jgi:hypothetical protein
MGSATESIFERLETAIAEWSVEIKSSSSGMAEKLARAKDRLGDTPEGAASLEALTASLDFARAEFARLEVALRECLGAAKSANDRAGESSASTASLQGELTAFREQTSERLQALESVPDKAPPRDEALHADVESLRVQVHDLRELAEQTTEPETEESLAALCTEVESLRSAVAELRETAAAGPREDVGALQSELSTLKNDLALLRDARQDSVPLETRTESSADVMELRNEISELRHALAEAADTIQRVDELNGLLAIERERSDRLEQQIAEAGQRVETAGIPQHVSLELDRLREELAEIRATLPESRMAFPESEREPEVPAYAPPPPQFETQRAAVMNLDLSGFDDDGRRRRMGDILVDADVLSQEQLEEALQEQQEHPQRRLGAILVELGHAQSDVIAQVLACQLKLPYVHLEEEVPEEGAVRLVSSRLARHHRCIPVRLEEETIILAMSNPLDLIAIEDIELATSRRVNPIVASEPDIAKAIEWFYGND